MKSKKEELVIEALMAVADRYPNSVVADLLAIFPPDVVAKILITFSGETVHFPKVESLWSAYRAKVIKETLDAKDDKRVRRYLASYFGIPLSSVAHIYFREKRRVSTVGKRAVDRTVDRFYRAGVEEIVKDIKKVLFTKSRRKR